VNPLDSEGVLCFHLSTSHFRALFAPRYAGQRLISDAGSYLDTRRVTMLTHLVSMRMKPVSFRTETLQFLFDLTAESICQ
jgi:hypothetical protein